MVVVYMVLTTYNQTNATDGREWRTFIICSASAEDWSRSKSLLVVRQIGAAMNVFASARAMPPGPEIA